MLKGRKIFDVGFFIRRTKYYIVAAIPFIFSTEPVSTC